MVQIIDSLLIPPSNITLTSESFNFTSYEGALYKTERVANLTDRRDVTILVPRNEAFTALGPAISSMSMEELASVIDYSIIPQLVYSTSLMNGSRFATLQGGNISVLHSGNDVYINSAQLLTSDILISNGVMHVVDNVLNPQGAGALPNPALPSQAPAFASASEVENLPFTSAIPCTVSCPVTTTDSPAIPTSTTRAPSNTLASRSSKGYAAAMAQETGFKAAGLIAALGGAILLI